MFSRREFMRMLLGASLYCLSPGKKLKTVKAEELCSDWNEGTEYQIRYLDNTAERIVYHGSWSEATIYDKDGTTHEMYKGPDGNVYLDDVCIVWHEEVDFSADNRYISNRVVSPQYDSSWTLYTVQNVHITIFSIILNKLLYSAIWAGIGYLVSGVTAAGLAVAGANAVADALSSYASSMETLGYYTVYVYRNAIYAYRNHNFHYRDAAHTDYLGESHSQIYDTPMY